MLQILIEKRKLVLVFFAMLVLVGAITLYQLPKREVPEINPPVAVVTTIYPGAQAQQVERYVTNKIEEKLLGLGEIKEVSSVSSPGVSRVSIQLKDGVDSDQAWNLVMQKLTEAETGLPQGSESPVFNDDLSMQGISLYHFTCIDESALGELTGQLDYWERQLTQIPGVAKVVFQGKQEREILITLSPQHLRQHQLSWNQVIGVLGAELNTIPPGQWQLGQANYPLQYTGASNVSQLAQLIVGQGGQVPVVRLQDVAMVEETYQTKSQGVTYLDQPAITMTIFMDPGTDILSLEKDINLLMSRLALELPSGVELHKIYSQAGPVTQLFKDLLIAFSIALVLVVIICSAGLNLATSFSVALAIPISIALGAIVLPFVGVDMNQISLIAFIIVLGILVDDAIVVNENIQRNLRLGKKPLQAVITGTKEVGISVITSTVIVVFTFFPLLFLSAASGAFIKPLPAIIISTMLASTGVALVLVPIYRLMLEQGKVGFGSQKAGWLSGPLDRVADWYSQTVLKKVVANPIKVVIVGFTLSLASFLLIPLIPLEFFPDTDREEVFVEMALPVGATFQTMEQEATKVKGWFDDQDFVRETSLFVGTEIPRLFGMTSSTGGGPHTANILVYIHREQILASQVADQLNRQLKQQFPRLDFTVTNVQAGPPVGAPIALLVKGDSPQVLMELAREIKELLAQHLDVVSVNDDGGRPLTTLGFQANRRAMEHWGVTSQQVTEALRLLGDGIPFGELDSNNSLLDMRIVLDNDQTAQPISRLEQASIRAVNGQWVPLARFVDVETIFTQQNIPHRDGVPTITVRAYPATNASADEIINQVRPEAEALLAPLTGYQLEVAGETSARTDVFVEIGKIFIVVMFLVLIVIALQFYSLTLPVLILSSVVLAVAGAIIGLFVTQTGLGFMSLLGVVSLAGIVVRNGIVMVEFIQNNRQQLTLEEAVQEAGKQRMRPIVLTTMTTICGLMPLVLGSNNLFRPLAIAIVAGMMFSSALSAVMVPALYMMWAKMTKAASLEEKEKKSIGIS